ncbi:unnamed protein product [Parascedosporium putredinis]|uniref:Transcriptional regulatory protein DEP1 n=1 Tax=Parascedosporium putredinis TaxID=1442378 RepID=A0A9P1H674_9PEZI|nr:unnamed protein product [Parascedosporium putredinis]CAI7998472.1 unnamed protein product [Parascedosporium putredinis]
MTPTPWLLMIPTIETPSDSESNLSEANDTEAETERLYDTPQVTRHQNVVLGRVDEDDALDVTPTKQSAALIADAIQEEDDPLSDVDISAPPSSPPDDLPSSRSPIVDRSDSEAPLRKRAASNGVPERDSRDGDKVADSKNNKPRSVRSGSGSGDVKEERADSPPATDSPAPEPAVTKKITRNGRKQAKDSLTNGVDTRDDDGPSDEEAEPRVDDDVIDGDPDEDAEATGKQDDEEAERKRIALDEWTTIEEKFSIFRDRLYKDRLEKLESEEQALTADVPYHPEYLNMKQCLDELHEEKLQKINKEYELILEANDRVAVARRAIIWGQFYQGIPPDYALLFPPAPAQRTRNAVAYNTEVSILSGMAKHIGFPAAPPMRGASVGEIEEDIEAIRVSYNALSAPNMATRC